MDQRTLDYLLTHLEPRISIAVINAVYHRDRQAVRQIDHQVVGNAINSRSSNDKPIEPQFNFNQTQHTSISLSGETTISIIFIGCHFVGEFKIYQRLRPVQSSGNKCKPYTEESTLGR